MTEERYIRNLPAVSEAQQRLLGQKTVAVVGCGGLGGYLVEFMGRLGAGCLRMIDGDVFSESNLNRQLLSEAATLGRNKAECAAARLRRINPAVRAEAFPVFLTADNAGELLRGCDAVLDGLDTVRDRKTLAEACSSLGIPCIYGGISAWTAQAALSRPGDGLIHRLYPGETPAQEPCALSFTPALGAAMQAALCTRLLCDQPAEEENVWYFDLFYGDFEKIHI